jgi:hypothetical protein
MLPADNYWHARVEHRPTARPSAPGGGGLASFPVRAAAGYDDPLRLDVLIGAPEAKTLTRATGADPDTWVTIDGTSWNRESEFTRVESATVLGVQYARAGLLRQHLPETVEVGTSSKDGHALIVDTDRCTLYEYMHWDDSGPAPRASRAAVFDLRTDRRRLSSRPGWLSPAQNGPALGGTTGAAIDSPYVATPATTPGLDGYRIDGPRGSTTASAGSGLQAAPGMIRLDEVFASPGIDSDAVRPGATIDHALAATIPGWHITSMPATADGPAPFVWPATRSDGCGGGGTCVGDIAGIAGSAHHLPMGSRLRLGATACTRRWSEPQARVIVEAMCRHGVVVTDSSSHFAVAAERSYEPPSAEFPQGRSKWRREARRELATLTIRDFDLVDMAPGAEVDPHALWSTATAWAERELGAGTALDPGWYEGRFWGSLMTCERPASTPLLTTRPACHDPLLARAEAAVDSDRWMAARR